MKISLVIYDLGCGGAERVLTALANHLAEEGHEVSLIALAGSDPFFPLSDRIHHTKLNQAGSSRNQLAAVAANVRRIIALRRAFKQRQPQVIISFMDESNVRVLLASIGLKIPVIASVRCDPRIFSLNRMWALLQKLTYPHLYSLVTQTLDIKRCFEDMVRRIDVIPNPIEIPNLEATPSAASQTILGVGRLGVEKGFDTLIKAFSQIHSRHPTWRLIICGDGDQRENLNSLVKDLKLEEFVRFAGKVKDVAVFFRSASIFVLSSRSEGFPNVLLEASAHGLPLVSTRFSAGIDEIIQHDLNGLIVPPDNPEEIAEALSRIIESDELYDRLSKQAIANARRFDAESVFKQWNALTIEAVNAQEKHH